MPLLFAAAIAWSYLAQFAAGYAPGFVASNGFGLLCDKASGATEFQAISRRTRVTPSEWSVASVPCGFEEDAQPVLEDRFLIAGGERGARCGTDAERQRRRNRKKGFDSRHIFH